MTNPDNVGGLPAKWRELAEKYMRQKDAECDAMASGLAQCADELEAELCRAAPAGGDAVRDALAGQAIYLMGREHINEENKPLAELVYGMTVPGTGVLFCMKDTEAAIPKDSAPAGSGEVEELIDELRNAVDRANALADRWDHIYGRFADELRSALERPTRAASQGQEGREHGD